MKKSLVFSLLAILAVCGCNVEDKINTQEPLSEGKVFTATIEDNNSGGTKTSLDANGNVLWKQGDQVSIFDGSTINEQYQVTDESDGKTAASLYRVTNPGFVAGTDIDNNVAFYPYGSTASISKNGTSYVISDITLPATQNYAENSFGNGVFPMVAVTSSTADMNLKFKNVLGGIKLQLKGTATIATITITGNNNEILCGAAEVTASNGNVPSISLTDASAKTVTLNCGSGVQLNTETATSFIIALPPITMSGGFTVTVTDTESKQMEISTTKSQTITRSSLLKMPVVNYVGIASENPLKFTSTGSTSLSLTQQGTPDAISLEYKVNTGSWSEYTIGNSIALSDGDEVSFRAGADGNAHFSKNYNDYYYFAIIGSGTVAASGNIMSLLDRSGSTNISGSCRFYRLFEDCTRLITPPELPATTMERIFYAHMFKGCTSLTSAPALPATTLNQDCYAHMFEGCTSLTSAPALPATTLAAYCYGGMFSGCTSLTTAPALPATTLEYGCYWSMFEGCTSLTSAPELPATTLASRCYQDMFSGCTSLISAPALSATTLAENCYLGMFHGCTSLTTAPELPATTLADGCYFQMFSGCTSLEQAPSLPALTLAPSCYYYMFSDCTSLTSAPALPAITLVSCCYEKMFSGCTGLTTAPALPATTLAEYCYRDMFSDCTSLTSAPILPATTLAESCYESMFWCCTSLNYIKMLAIDVSASDCLKAWVLGVASTGTFVKNASATWDVTGWDGIPSGWSVITE